MSCLHMSTSVLDFLRRNLVIFLANLKIAERDPSPLCWKRNGRWHSGQIIASSALDMPMVDKLIKLQTPCISCRFNFSPQAAKLASPIPTFPYSAVRRRTSKLAPFLFAWLFLLVGHACAPIHTHIHALFHLDAHITGCVCVCVWAHATLKTGLLYIYYCISVPTCCL